MGLCNRTGLGRMNENVLLSVFVAVEGAHAFSAFMPSYFTVKKFSESEEDIKALRSGYTPAIAFDLSLGILVSLIIKDYKPLILAALICAFMVSLYEGAINKQEQAPENLEVG